ncbi:MAG: malate:quinone oxidoreductase, partial [Mycobacteriaceae bacterium]|nr:malate:quinone oxidoreductase [Mycobacteriaceae bacterium]
DPRLVNAHRAKVYGFPASRAPNSAAPHLDLRIVSGKPWLMFGPFVGWSPKSLKHGRLTDLTASVKRDNLMPMLSVGLTQRNLLTYLAAQVRLTQTDRVKALREFAPSASVSDWQTIAAGQRVQVIRPVKGRHGVLDFGTAVLAGRYGGIAGLLGASPGASTAVPAMVAVLERCFPDRYQWWLPKLTEMVPSLGTRLSDEPRLFREVWDWSTAVLGLDAQVDPALEDREEHQVTA